MTHPALRLFARLVSVLAVLAIALLHHSAATAQEAVVFDKTIDWNWKLPQANGGNGFYWWHRTDVKPYMTDYCGMPDDDWTKPHDFWNGEFYARVEVLEQPSKEPFSIQFAIWQDKGKKGGWSECTSSQSPLSGGAGSSVEKCIGTPAKWWQLRKDAPVDFSRPEDFYRIGIVLWKGNGNCIPYAQGWSASRAQCKDAVKQAPNFFPLRARVTIVAVAAGHKFSGWENYPKPADPKAP